MSEHAASSTTAERWSSALRLLIRLLFDKDEYDGGALGSITTADDSAGNFASFKIC